MNKEELMSFQEKLIEFEDDLFSKVDEAVFELEDLLDELKEVQFKRNINMLDFIDTDSVIEYLINKVEETIKKIEY